MPAPNRRRWFSLSLRTVLIGMTVISVGFAWFLHHRREKIAERERSLPGDGFPQPGSPGFACRPAVHGGLADEKSGLASLVHEAFPGFSPRIP